MASVKKNFLYQMVYEVLIILLPLITSPYISRVLGAELLGVYSYSYSIAYYFQLVCMLGIKYHGARTIAAVRNDKEKLNRAFSSLLTLHVTLSLVIILLYFIYAIFINNENTTIVLIQSLNVIAALFDINWFFFGMEKFKVTVTRNSIIKILTVVCIFIFVRNKNDLWIYTLIMSLGMAISQSVVWTILPKYVKFVKPHKDEILAHLKPLLVLFVPILAVSIFKYMDKIMLGILSTKTEVGFYENAEKAINIPSTVILAFGTVMLPKISNLNALGLSKKSDYYTSASFKYILCLAIGMSFGLFAVADNFSVLFWGDEFENCGMLIRILSISIPFTAYANIVRTQYLMPMKKDNIYLISMLIGAVINFSLNMILVSYWKSMGVSIATLVSEFAVMVYQMFAVRKDMGSLKYIKSFIFFYIPATIMALVVMEISMLLPVTILNLCLEIVLGIVLYGIGVFVYLYLQKDEMLMRYLKKLQK